MKESVKLFEGRKNVLTEDLVTKFYDALVDGAKISKPKFTKEDIGQMLATIYAINALPHGAKSLKGTSLKDYSMPKGFDELVVGFVNLSGSMNQKRLISFVNESDYTIFEAEELIDFGRRFTASFRVETKLNSINDVVGYENISDFSTRLVLNKDRVSSDFVAGNYPLISEVDVFEDFAEGMSINVALQLYLNEFVSKI